MTGDIWKPSSSLAAELLIPPPRDSVIADTRKYLDDYVGGAMSFLIPDITDFLARTTLPYLRQVQASNRELALNEELSPHVPPLESRHRSTIKPEDLLAYERARIIMGYMPEIPWGLPLPDHFVKVAIFPRPRNSSQFAVRVAEMGREIAEIVNGETRPGINLNRDLSLLRTVSFFRAGDYLNPSHKIS